MKQIFDPIELLRPKRVIFGSAVVAEVGEAARSQGFKRLFIVSDAFNAARIDLLQLTGTTDVFSSFAGEPTTDDLAAMLERVEAFSPDCIIGFGGGSAMDLAKLAAVLPFSGQSFGEVVGPEKVHGRKIGLIQVPTTSGTGSEAGTRALVTDVATKAKLAVQSVHMLADWAVIDPDLTLSVPAPITVATGVDALAHCVEAYTNKKAHPLIDLYALEGIRLVGKWLPIAARDGSHKEARAGLSLASYYGGICLGPVNTAAGHAVAYPLGSRHHIAHGLANAVIFPHVLACNAPVVPERTADILAALGLEASARQEDVFERAYQWCVDLGCDMRLRSLNVPETDFESMAQEAHGIRRLMDNNPRDLTPADILSIYRAAY